MGTVRCNCKTCQGHFTATSLSVHDYVHIPGCDNRTFVDGGNDYLRYGGKDMSLIEVVTIRKKPRYTSTSSEGTAR